MTCTQIALLAAKAHNCNAELMEIVAQRFLSNIKALRLKDMERVCYAFTKLDFADTQLFQSILTEMPDREAELRDFPRVFARCTRYLAANGMPCQPLIRIILSPDWLASTYGGPENFDEEILFLDAYARISSRCAYDGPRLSKEQRHTFASIFCTDKHNAVEMEVFDAVRNVYRHPRWLHALPHYSKPGTLDFTLRK